jgi:RNA recognition motif-containing protein
MAKKLFVGGLSDSTSEDSLSEAFSKAGKVASVAIITHRDTGNSKGFGFVEMESDDDANKAIEMYNGQVLDGRELTVNEARPKVDRPQGFRSGGGGGWGGGDRGRGGFDRRR